VQEWRMFLATRGFHCWEPQITNRLALVAPPANHGYRVVP
jgi:hypothetical protein